MEALYADIPLEDVGVMGFLRAQVVAVVVAPESERAILVALRLRDTKRKRIGERRKLRLEVVGGEEHRIAGLGRCAGVLEIRRGAEAVVDAGPATDNSFLIPRIRE